MSAEIKVKVTTEAELIVSERTHAALVALGWKPPADHGGHMKPTLGRIVHYRGKQGRLAMRAAIVTGTVDSLDPDGIDSGDVLALGSEHHVHLWVFTPGSSGGFPEFNVPHGEGDEDDEGIPPGSWCWPPRA